MKAVAEAPGKVIIAGEHFVVHGATALSAAIGRSVRVEASRADRLSVRSTVGSRKGLSLARQFVESLYGSRDTDPKVSISIDSTLPEGAGLGSSAATMLAMASAANALEGWGLNQESLMAAAGGGEKLVHGNPSGIDVATSSVGGVIMFTRGEPPKRVPLRAPVSLLVAYTGRKRSTGRLISQVALIKKAYPHLFAGLCDAASVVSSVCAESLDTGDIGTLGRMMTYSHAVLARVGASTPGLDRLVDRCLECGCIGAKLTGAGGGGSVLAVPPPGDAEAARVVAELTKKGYDTFLTEIPTEGARAWLE